MIQLAELIQNPIAWPGIAVLLVWAAVELWPRGLWAWVKSMDDAMRPSDRSVGGRGSRGLSPPKPRVRLGGYQPTSPHPVDPADLEPPTGDMAIQPPDGYKAAI